MIAQAADVLKDTFQENSILRIAIVDDGYDLPEVTAVTEQDWLAFSTAVDEAEGKFGAHQALLTGMDPLPNFNSLRAEHVHQLWRHHSLRAIDAEGQPAADDAIGEALAAAFTAFAGRKMQKLQQLRHVERVAERAAGTKPILFHSAVTASELLDFDLVFLDFFLGDEVDQNGDISPDMQMAAETKACRLVKDVTDQLHPKPAPLFVVISSLATNDNVPRFRDNAKLLGSKFRFLSKGVIEKDPVRRDFVLQSLAKQRAAGDAVELLTTRWQDSIERALEDMMASIRRLDIADYAYIKDFRLTEEKVSLLNYLTWLYNSYLGSFIEERLAQTDSAAMDPLTALVSKSAILRPMSEVPRIYSRITTTKVREFADGETANVTTGDIFVRRTRLAQYTEPEAKPEAIAIDALPAATEAAPELAAAAMPLQVSPPPANDGTIEPAPAVEKAEPALPPPPDVIAAVTPVCDLVPGRIKAKNVVLVGGALTELSKTREASNHLLVYERSSNEAPVEFQIKWDTKSPVSFPVDAFDGEGIAGTDYVHVTRLRELYSAEIAQGLAADLGRVGVPIAPPFTRALDLEVRAANVKQPIFSTIGKSGAALVWDVLKKKTGQARHIVFSEEFLWELVNAVRDRCPQDSPCLELVSELQNLEDLLKPFDSSTKNPTKAGVKIAVKVMPDGSRSQAATGKELLTISVYVPKDQ